MAAPNLFVVILAGGSGTRFWPASRRARPKQFLPIGGGESLLAETFGRLEGLVPAERVLVVTVEEHAELVREALPELPAENVIAEPAPRNTAPCIALAALEVHRRAPGAVQAVLPADHVISPPSEFRRSLRVAAAEAERGGLLTFGIRPTFPATGYGYIEAGAELREVDGFAVHAVERFVEKPDRARAEEFLATGRFLWNGGIFVWRTDAILDALRRFVPETLARLEGATSRAELARVYPELAKEPIDVAVLEKAPDVRVIPLAYAWNDVGSWAALPEVLERDAHKNYVSGGTKLLAEDAEGCVVYGRTGGVTALVGVRDLVVVHAGNATLVCPRDRAQEIKRIVERLADEAPEFL